MTTAMQIPAELQRQLDEFTQEGRLLMAVTGGNLFPCDAMAIAVIDRSVQLARGFMPLLLAENVVAGAALLRLQLDNALRFGAVSKSADPHELAMLLIEGTQLDKTKGEDGERRTDGNLRKALNDPNFDRLYVWASSHVHLSGLHVRHLLQAARPRQDGRREFHIGGYEPYLPPGTTGMLAQYMVEAGERVIKVLAEWRLTREPFAAAACQRFTRSIAGQEKFVTSLLP